MHSDRAKKAVMNVREVSEYLDIHPQTVYKYTREGKIPAFKIGDDWRFYTASIEKWIKEKEEFNVRKKERRRNQAPS